MQNPFRVILFEPEIPPNTGNIIRLCANTGAELHLIEPLGFEITDTQLRRAGLDYHEYTTLATHKSWEACNAALIAKGCTRIFAVSTRGATRFDKTTYLPGDGFLFGPETRGLPQALLDSFPEDRRIRLPMRPDNRSLNLSNAVAITVFEAWRQNGFFGGN